MSEHPPSSPPSSPTTPRQLESPPLEDLRTRALVPGAAMEEIDALLLGIAQPLRPTESARERADVLHRIIDDPWLGGFSGSDGRRVDRTAAKALLALGEPYASELSQDGRKVLSGKPEARPVNPPTRAKAGTRARSAARPTAEPPDSQQKWKISSILVMGVFELLVMLGFNVVKEGVGAVLLLLVYLTLTSAMPEALLSSREPSWVARFFARMFLLFALVPWAVPFVFFSSLFKQFFPWSLLPVVGMAGRLVAFISSFREREE